MANTKSPRASQSTITNPNLMPIITTFNYPQPAASQASQSPFHHHPKQQTCKLIKIINFLIIFSFSFAGLEAAVHPSPPAPFGSCTEPLRRPYLQFHAGRRCCYPSTSPAPPITRSFFAVDSAAHRRFLPPYQITSSALPQCPDRNRLCRTSSAVRCHLCVHQSSSPSLLSLRSLYLFAEPDKKNERK